MRISGQTHRIVYPFAKTAGMLSILLFMIVFHAAAGEKWDTYSTRQGGWGWYGDILSKSLSKAGAHIAPAPEFRIPNCGKKPKVLFLVDHTTYRHVLELAARFEFEWEALPFSVFCSAADSTDERIAVQNKKRYEHDFMKIITETKWDVFVVERPPAYLTFSLIGLNAREEMTRQIESGTGYLELGFPAGGTDNPVETGTMKPVTKHDAWLNGGHSTPLPVSKSTLGKGKIIRYMDKKFQTEEDYFKFWRALLAAAGCDSFLKVNLKGKKLLIENPGKQREYTVFWELCEELRGDRRNGVFPAKLSPQGSGAFQIPVPADLEPGSYDLLCRVENTKTGKTMNWAFGKYQTYSAVPVRKLVLKPYYARAAGLLTGSVEIGGFKPEDVRPELHVRMLDSMGRPLPFQTRKELPVSTVPGEYSFELRYDPAYLYANCGFVEAFLTVNGQSGSFRRQLFFAPRNPEEQAGDWQQIAWGVRGSSMYLLNLHTDMMRDYGFNAYLSGDADFSFFTRLCRTGLPIHVENLSLMGHFSYETQENVWFAELCDPAWRAEKKEKNRKRAEELVPLGLFGMAAAEEMGLGKSEVCFRPSTQRAFGKWAVRKHGSLEKVNEIYGTNYAREEEIQGIRLEEMLEKKPENPAQFIDFRTFMMETYCGLVTELFYPEYHKIMPDAGIGCNCIPTAGGPWQGLDASYLGKTIRYAMEYTPNFLGKHPLYFSSADFYAARGVKKLYVVIGYPTMYMPESSNYEYRTWYTALHGGRGVAYYYTDDTGEFQKFDSSYAPSNVTLAIRDLTADLRHGLGKFIIESEPVEPIAVYSNDNGWMLDWVLGRRCEKDSTLLRNKSAVRKEDLPENTGFTETEVPANQKESAGKLHLTTATDARELLIACGFRPGIVFRDQILSGEIKKFKSIFLGGVRGMSEKEIDALREYVEAGGRVVADASTGIFDELGRSNPHREKLDALFGIQRNGGLPGLLFGSLKTASGDSFPFQIIETIRPRPGTETPVAKNAFLRKKTRLGETLYIGGTARTTDAKGNWGEPLFADGARNILKEFLGPAPVTLRLGGKNLPGIHGLEISEFRNGKTTAVFLLRRFFGGENADELLFPAKKHIYDVRAKQYLGFTDRIPFALPRKGTAAGFVLLDYKLKELSATATAPVIAPGGKGTVRLSLLPENNAPMEKHYVSLRFYRPSGAEEHRFETNLTLHGGTGTHAFAFSLNEEKGTWRIEAEEAFSGLKASATFELK